MSISDCKRSFDNLRESYDKAAHYLAEGNAFEYEHWIMSLNGLVRKAMSEAIEWADAVETSERVNRKAEVK